MERTVTLAELPAEVDQIADRLRNGDWTPALAEIQAELEADHAENIAQATEPDGTPLTSLSPVTIAAKGHDTILVETGALGDSLADPNAAYAIREFIDDGDTKGVLYGTRRPHAGVHQHGSRDGRIPQRRFMGFNQDLIDRIKGIVAQRAVEILTGGE